MMKNKRHNIVWLFSCFFALLMIAGCDNTIDGFDEDSGAGGFSVFGFLDYNRDVNFIRVKDLTVPILSDSVTTIDADVTLSNMDTGDSEKLQDSVVVFEGIATHNFRSTMNITPETAYRLRVEDSDGFTQTFDAVTPADAEVTIDPESGYTCRTFIQITFDPVRSNELLQGEFGFDFRGVYITVDADVQQNDNKAQINFQLSTIVAEGIGSGFLCGSEVNQIELTYTHFGPGYEEIFNDFENLGTEQFIGLFQDTLLFSISS